MTTAGEDTETHRPRVAHNQSVQRAVALIQCFIDDDGTGASLSELARRTGMHVSTAYRIAQTLVAGGILTRDPRTDRYSPGIALLALAGATFSGSGLDRTQEVLGALAAETGESVAFGVADEDCVVVLSSADSPADLRFGHRAGSRLPLHATALGKVLLAFPPHEAPGDGDDAEGIETVVRRLGRLERFAPGSITRGRDLLADLRATRKRGHAVTDEELVDGVRAVAVPVRDTRGIPRAALSVTGPAVRLTADRDAELAAMAHRAADAVGNFPVIARLTVGRDPD